MEAQSQPKKNDAAKSREMSQDEFVYLVWSNLVFVKIFFARFLPAALSALIDLDSLELSSTRFTSREGRDSFADLFYKFRFKSGKRGVLSLLIEHKSQYDRYVSLQIMRYELAVFDLMEREPEKYVDEDGLLPVPYSILLCQTPCPQYDAIVSHCEGLDYGLRSHFQQICFNEIDVDSILDEPLLLVALGLTRFAGYKDQDKEQRQSELLTLFRSFIDFDPLKSENLKETWKFILEVSLNYLSRIMRNTSFNMKQFKYELLNAKGYEMHSQIDDDVFEEFFYDKIQPYKDAVQSYKDEARSYRDRLTVVQAENVIAEAKTQEALARAEAADELFLTTMYETIEDTLCDAGKVKQVSEDVSNKLKEIKSYPFLCKLLRIATSARYDYDSFLSTLEEGKE